MNYFIDFIPSDSFLKEIQELKIKLGENINLILNMYIKQLPSMNINEFMYCDIEESIQYISKIKKSNLKINIMLDTFCFGNKEFTKVGKEIFDYLDKIFKLDIDYITVTNNFFFNYIKRKHSDIKVIISEYSDITNAQKINRYLENIKADAVKLDFKLCLDNKKMKYIKNNFDVNCIHIDMNKFYYNNDIYKDYLNNSLSHYIQENKWELIKKCIEDYTQKQINLKNEQICFSKQNYNELKEIGYKNFWYYYNSEISKDDYINEFISNIT